MGSVVTVPHFLGGVDGSQPSSPLLLASDGQFIARPAAVEQLMRTVYRADADGSLPFSLSCPGGHYQRKERRQAERQPNHHGNSPRR
jgi:hypothetical protein